VFEFHGDVSPKLHLCLLKLCSSHFAVAQPPRPCFCDPGHSAVSVPSGHPWKAAGEQHAPHAFHLQNGDAARGLRRTEIPIMGRRTPQVIFWQKPMGTCLTCSATLTPCPLCKNSSQTALHNALDICSCYCPPSFL